ncbi:hypothetical protein CHU98_g1380 [Xylaria longipes]|nr:hypothetical protein CHU98_g1380 [Xylaria longipes]
MLSRDIIVDAPIKPLEITVKDPAILFVQLYTTIAYATDYSFFDSFPLVYPVYYGMTPGEVGLVFLAIHILLRELADLRCRGAGTRDETRPCTRGGVRSDPGCIRLRVDCAP